VEPSDGSPTSPTAATASRHPVGRCDLWISGKRLRSRIIEDVSRGTLRWLANRAHGCHREPTPGGSLRLVDIRQASSAAASSEMFHLEPSDGSLTESHGCHREPKPGGSLGLGGYRASDLRSRTIEDVSRGTFRWFANRIPRLPPRAETRWVVATCGYPASTSSTASSEMFRVEPSHGSHNRLPQLLPRTGTSVGRWGLWMCGKRLRSRVIEDVSRGTSRGLPRALVAMMADSNPA
jgi:hypothetical protein